MRMTKLFKSTVLVAVSVFCGIAFAQSQSEMPKAAVYIKGNPQGRDALRMAVNTFLTKSGKYQMVAVDAIDVVVKEQKRQMSGSVNDAQIAKLGNDAGAEYVCVVERTELEGVSYVSTRMVSVESKVAEFADMVKIPKGGDIIEIIQGQIGAMLGMELGTRKNTAQSTPQSKSITYGSLRDPRDGKAYKTVTIGDDKWMAENLNYEPKSVDTWCYDEEKSNCAKYGRLYDWNTANTVCPAGWKLPSREDWDNLGRAVKGRKQVNKDGRVTWNDAGTTLKTGSGWGDYKGKNGNGTNDYGFSALPAGKRQLTGRFGDAEYTATWWTNAESDVNKVYVRSISYQYDFMIEYNHHSKTEGLSVRCVEQKPVNHGSFRDPRDGKTYKTAEIGGKTWTAENLNYQPQSGNYWCRGNDNANCAKYGKLYDWNTARTVCPSGWGLPSRQEWEHLVAAIGGGSMAGRKLKANAGWNNGNGTDEYGFSALPGGWRNYGDGSYQEAGLGGWWMAAPVGADSACGLLVGDASPSVLEFCDNRGYGLSVRCVQRTGDEAAVAEQQTYQPPTPEPVAPSKQQTFVDGSGILTDGRDGKRYKTVVVGGKRWMAENLNHGDGESRCYNNNSSNCGKYGMLYDWNTAKMVCPTGFHLPSRQEWNDLVETAGGNNAAGKKLKARSGWNNNSNGTDDFGFSALPSGYYYSRNVGDFGYWWTATEGPNGRAYSRSMGYGGDNVIEENDVKNYDFSVRCIADK